MYMVRSKVVNSLLAKFDIWQMYQTTHQLQFFAQTLSRAIYLKSLFCCFGSGVGMERHAGCYISVCHYVSIRYK